jgi:hypothetical protein
MTLTILLNHIVSRAWIVDHDSLHVIQGLVAFVVHSICNVWNVVACIGLSSDVDLTVLKVKGLHEVLPEAKELGCYFDLIGSCWFALRKTSADRLFNPNSVGQIGESVLVLDWCECAKLKDLMSALR